MPNPNFTGTINLGSGPVTNAFASLGTDGTVGGPTGSPTNSTIVNATAAGANSIPVADGAGNYAWSTDSPLDKDNGQAGMYAIPQPLVVQSAGLTLAAGMVRGVRIRPSRSVAMIKAEIVIMTVAGANDSIEFAVYQDAGSNNPINRVATTGLVAGIVNTSIQVHNINLTFTLSAAINYYLVLSYGVLGGTAPKLASIGTVDGAIFQGQIFGPRFPAAELFQADGIVVAGNPLPSTLTYTASVSAPLFTIRES